MSKVSPRNALKVDEADQAEYLNHETYMHYYTRLMLMCTSLFKWSNLPNGIPERFIEKNLFNFGQLAFFDDESFGLMVTKCTQTDMLNLYDEAIKWNCFSNNGYSKIYEADKVSIIRNNKYSIPTCQLLQHHLKRLFNIERTIDVNLWQQRHLAVIKSSESQRLTMQNLMKNYDEYGYMIFGSDKINLNDIETLNFEVPFIGIQLEDLKERKWNDLINMLGINSANTQKKERLITDEANANNQMILLNVDVMLAEREHATQEINERYNLDIKVEVRQGIDNSVNEEGGKVE